MRNSVQHPGGELRDNLQDRARERRKASARVFGFAALFFAALALLSHVSVLGAGPSAIHFTYKAIPFLLDSCETPQKHAPETMAGGVAVFDYDNDGSLDIFFTNGADITTLNKTSPKYWDRLFHNNGDGTFTDVTEKAGLAGTGYDTGVAIADYDNDGFEDIFIGGVHRNKLRRRRSTSRLWQTRSINSCARR